MGRGKKGNRGGGKGGNWRTENGTKTETGRGKSGKGKRGRGKGGNWRTEIAQRQKLKTTADGKKIVETGENRGKRGGEKGETDKQKRHKDRN